MDPVSLPQDVRATPQRQAVVDAINRAPGAFTAAGVYERARRAHGQLGFATVYRTIDVLRAAGAIRPLTGDPSSYVRCRPGHHHHLICVSCGSVEETELCAAPSAAQLRRRHGFSPEAHDVDVYGTCRRCAA